MLLLFDERESVQLYYEGCRSCRANKCVWVLLCVHFGFFFFFFRGVRFSMLLCPFFYSLSGIFIKRQQSVPSIHPPCTEKISRRTNAYKVSDAGRYCILTQRRRSATLFHQFSIINKKNTQVLHFHPLLFFFFLSSCLFHLVPFQVPVMTLK